MSDNEYSEEILAEVEEDDIFLYDKVVGVFFTYGWHLLILGIILGYVFSRLKPYLLEIKKRKDEDAYAAKYHKDTNLARTYIEAQEAQARRLQEKYKQDAEAYKMKMERKEELKRQENLKKLEGKSDGGIGKRLGNEYNPLMGDSSRGYKAVKKSPCGGGGCG